MSSIDKLRWSMHCDLPDAHDASPLLDSWRKRLVHCQDANIPCGFSVSDFTVTRVLQFIAASYQPGAVILAHHTLFNSEVYRKFDKLLDMNFCHVGADMTFRGYVNKDIPVVGVNFMHYAKAYSDIDSDWLAMWYPEEDAQFWRYK